jgi:hypothetical protein
VEEHSPLLQPETPRYLRPLRSFVRNGPGKLRTSRGRLDPDSSRCENRAVALDRYVYAHMVRASSGDSRCAFRTVRGASWPIRRRCGNGIAVSSCDRPVADFFWRDWVGAVYSVADDREHPQARLPISTSPLLTRSLATAAGTRCSFKLTDTNRLPIEKNFLSFFNGL